MYKASLSLQHFHTYSTLLLYVLSLGDLNTKLNAGLLVAVLDAKVMLHSPTDVIEELSALSGRGHNIDLHHLYLGRQDILDQNKTFASNIVARLYPISKVSALPNSGCVLPL